MDSNLVTFGFLPVLVFLIFDIFSGKQRALWCALAAGAGQLVLAAGRDNALDWMGIAAFALLAALVIVSIRERDDFFFKIHGALMNTLSAIVLLVGWYVFHKALLLDAATHFGLEKIVALEPRLDRAAVEEMLRLVSFHLPWWLLAHAWLTVHAASNWGKWGWAFVRIPGFIIMLFLASGFAQVAAR